MIPTDMSFEFKRLQYPVRLAFAMTINIVQGHRYKCVVSFKLNWKRSKARRVQLVTYISQNRCGHKLFFQSMRQICDVKFDQIPILAEYNFKSSFMGKPEG
jgi:hypothetical protein